jgi:diadenylate cyclase
MVEEKKSEIQVKLIKSDKGEEEKAKKEEVLEILKSLAPGTTLRTGIEGVLKAKTGGLIVIENERVSGIIEGGFKVNCRFTPQRLIELCKMDGAVVLSNDMKKILYANVLMIPDHSIKSNETGTRHKAAERTAKHAKSVVIAVSQRRGELTLFYKNVKYVVKETSEITRRATEILQILEKHRDIFDNLEKELTRLERSKRAKVTNVTLLIQRGKIILKTSDILRRYLIELGNDGTIIKGRSKEILHGVEREVNHVIQDYTKISFKKSKHLLDILNYDEILDVENIEKALGISKESKEIFPRGHRILSKSGFSEEEIGSVIGNFKNLNKILELKKEDLGNFDSEKADLILDRVKQIREGTII